MLASPLVVAGAAAVSPLGLSWRGLADAVLGPYIEDVKPVVQAGGSDTATLDNVFELLVRAGRDAPMAKALMIPASIGQDATMPPAHRDMFLYCNAVMEPWDGPAAIAATDGRWVIAGLDRNGLRPLRYTITADDLLIVGWSAATCAKTTTSCWSRRLSRERHVLSRRHVGGPIWAGSRTRPVSSLISLTAASR